MAIYAWFIYAFVYPQNAKSLPSVLEQAAAFASSGPKNAPTTSMVINANMKRP